MRFSIPAFAVAAAMMAGCQAQPKPPAQGTSPSVLDVSAPRTPHQPSVYAMSAATPASYAARTSVSPSAGAPAYLPPPGSSTCAPPAGSFAADLAPVVASAPADVAPNARATKKDGKTYIVKQGDTLFHIAKAHYGSGSKWRQIAAANPGLTPTTLKAGQKLVMP